MVLHIWKLNTVNYFRTFSDKNFMVYLKNFDLTIKIGGKSLFQVWQNPWNMQQWNMLGKLYLSVLYKLNVFQQVFDKWVLVKLTIIYLQPRLRS